MKNDIKFYIDWFLKQHDGDYKSAMAWLIGRMNAAETDVAKHTKASCQLLDIPVVDRWIKTTIQGIDSEVE